MMMKAVATYPANVAIGWMIDTAYPRTHRARDGMICVTVQKVMVPCLASPQRLWHAAFSMSGTDVQRF
jgi:hypothetical protein